MYLCYVIICNEQYCARCREERADSDHITTDFLEDYIHLETSLKRVNSDPTFVVEPPGPVRPKGDEWEPRKMAIKRRQGRKKG